MEDSIVDYIQHAKKENKTKEVIFAELLQQGKLVDDVIRAYDYKDEETEHASNQKRTINIIVTAAALLVGAGVFSFVASNWQDIGRFVKIGIILAAMLASYAGGWYVTEKKEYEKVGSALYLLGMIIYGSGIFLVAQIFNIRANWPDGFILWMFGALALAFALNAGYLYALALVVGFVAIIGHPFILFQLSTAHDPFLFTSIILLVITTITVFVTAHFFYKQLGERERY